MARLRLRPPFAFLLSSFDLTSSSFFFYADFLSHLTPSLPSSLLLSSSSSSFTYSKGTKTLFLSLFLSRKRERERETKSENLQRLRSPTAIQSVLTQSLAVEDYWKISRFVLYPRGVRQTPAKRTPLFFRTAKVLGLWGEREKERGGGVTSGRDLISARSGRSLIFFRTVIHDFERASTNLNKLIGTPQSAFASSSSSSSSSS